MKTIFRKSSVYIFSFLSILLISPYNIWAQESWEEIKPVNTIIENSHDTKEDSKEKTENSDTNTSTKQDTKIDEEKKEENKSSTQSWATENKSSEETTLTWALLEEYNKVVNEENNTASFWDLTKRRMDMILNFNNSSLETRIKELEWTIRQKDLELWTLREINNTYEGNISNLETQINNKQWVQEELMYEINKYKEAIKQNNRKLAEIEAERVNTELILENLAKVQWELQDKEDKEFNRKIGNILITIAILWILYFISVLIYKHYRRKLSDNQEHSEKISKIVAQMNVVNVAVTIMVVLVLAFSIIYLKPELAVGFLFFGSAFIIIFKDAILSFIASILVMVKFNIWDDIVYEALWVKANWKITKLTPLFIVVREVDWDLNRDTYTWRIFNLPNKVVFESWLIKNAANYSHFWKSYFDFVIKLSDWENNLNYRNRMQEKMKEIDNYLEEVLPTLPNRDKWLFWNITTKFDKTIFYKEKEYIVRYEWIEPMWFDKNIKQFMFDVIMKE